MDTTYIRYFSTSFILQMSIDAIKIKCVQFCTPLVHGLVDSNSQIGWVVDLVRCCHCHGLDSLYAVQTDRDVSAWCCDSIDSTLWSFKQSCRRCLCNLAPMWSPPVMFEMDSDVDRSFLEFDRECHTMRESFHCNCQHGWMFCLFLFSNISFSIR